jgi:hypothetical protein
MQVNQQAFARTIRADGKLTINREDYYVSRSLAGKPGHVLGKRLREVLRHLAAWGTHQVGSDQGFAWPGDAFRGVCGADEAGSVLGIQTVSTHPSQADPRSPVGLSLQPAQHEGIRHPHHKFPARGGISLYLRLIKWR